MDAMGYGIWLLFSDGDSLGMVPKNPMNINRDLWAYVVWDFPYKAHLGIRRNIPAYPLSCQGSERLSCQFEPPLSGDL